MSVNWDVLTKGQCADSRHAYYTTRRLGIVVANGKWRFVLNRVVRCTWCRFRMSEPRDLQEMSRDLFKREAMKRAMMS
jgi:hypothetical protein